MRILNIQNALINMLLKAFLDELLKNREPVLWALYF